MIEETYQQLCKKPSDINEHLPTLKKYASECESIVELGVRSIVSTWALLAGKPKTMLSVDIEHPQTFGGDSMQVVDATNEEDIAWTFAQNDSLTVHLPEHDLLFIDTNHTYEQLSQELKKHSLLTKKYILMHDTNQQEFPEMRKAINNFLENNKEWELKEQFENCHGLTVFQRVC